MSDVFREVDEDLRTENLTKMWKQFGPFVIGAAVLVVAGVASYKGWNWYTANQAATAGLKFERALDAGQSGNSAQALTELQTIVNASPGDYPLMARLSTAGLKARNGDKEGAIDDYDAIAALSNIDPEIVEMARIQAAMLLLDSANRQTIVARMSGIASDTGPWRNAALEILGLAAWKDGATNDAADLFRQIIADPLATRGVRQRSQVMLALITPNETAAQTTSEPTQ